MAKKKLKIYMYFGNTGVGYWRGHLPMKYLKLQDLAEIRTSDFRWGQESDKITFPSIEELHDIGQWADIIVFERHDLLKTISTFCGLGEHFNIPVVLETDDDIEAVRPYNPGFRGYHPGSEALLWGREVVKKVNAITVTTKHLSDLHKDKCPVYILPNSLDVDERKNYWKSIKPHKNEIRIGWAGSGAHYENLKWIEEPVVRILEKYPNVVFYCMAMFASAVWKDAPVDIKKRIRWVDWSPLKEWPKTLASLSLDIGLAPAMDNLFNRSKSNLRYLEYGVNKIAVIASPTACYEDTMSLHAKEKDEWFDAMEKLILDEKLRNKLASKAQKDVLANYDMKKNCKLWLSAYEDIVDKYKKTHGPKLYPSLR